MLLDSTFYFGLERANDRAKLVRIGRTQTLALTLVTEVSHNM